MKQRLAAGDLPEEQILGKRLVARPGLDEPAREERLDLRAEHERVRPVRVVQRLDAHPIAREEQRALPRVPDREREHAVQRVTHSSPIAA